MKRFVNGVNIAHGLAGDGLPLVFIHGFPLSKEMWSREVSKRVC